MLHDHTVRAAIARDPVLRIETWTDPVLEAHGHDPAGRYTELYWLPIIGPSSLLAFRRLNFYLSIEPEGTVVEIPQLSKELGLGEGVGKNAPMVRTLARLVVFDFAHYGGDVFGVRRLAPPLSLRHVRRLPQHLVDQHERDRWAS